MAVIAKGEDDARQRRWTAHHEAGHATAAFCIGKANEIRYIDMVECEKYYGMVYFDDTETPLVFKAYQEHAPRSGVVPAKRRGSIYMAGPAAEAKYRGIAADWHELLEWISKREG